MPKTTAKRLDRGDAGDVVGAWDAPLQRGVAAVMYRYLCDPDGRPARLRREAAF